MATPSGSPERAPSKPCRYDYEVDLSSDSTPARVVRLVGTGKRVLELGCAAGSMSKAFHESGCQVVAIEVDRESAARASSFCERVIVGDIESMDLAVELGDDRFDTIVAADVLEHLKDPLPVLLAVQKYLRPNGYIVSSIPNVAHGSVRLALLSGKFPYGEVGLLDRTHLRFYTRESIEKLFADAGLAIVHVERKEMSIEASEVPHDETAVPADFLDKLSRDKEALTYQFIVVAYPAPRALMDMIERRIRESSEDRVRELAERNERLQLELGELRQTVETQGELQRYVRELVEGKDIATREIDDLRLVIDAADQLLSKACKIHASIHNLEAVFQGAGAVASQGDQSEDETVREDLSYRHLIARIRRTVRTSIPSVATIIVVSKGDDELLKLDGHRAWHFPQMEDGVYAGDHPVDSAAAIAHLEALRARGGDFLLFPATAFWWLEHYQEFRRHLEDNYRIVARKEDVCVIFALR
jgi:2-polyprenyl-3-methyl-5-hydroxy-6-metoxy-1,4-benzoquinol methylase